MYECVDLFLYIEEEILKCNYPQPMKGQLYCPYPLPIVDRFYIRLDGIEGYINGYIQYKKDKNSIARCSKCEEPKYLFKIKYIRGVVRHPQKCYLCGNIINIPLSIAGIEDYFKVDNPNISLLINSIRYNLESAYINYNGSKSEILGINNIIKKFVELTMPELPTILFW